MSERRNGALVNLIRKSVGLPTGQSSCCGAAEAAVGEPSNVAGSEPTKAAAEPCCAGESTKGDAKSCCSTDAASSQKANG